MKMTWDDETFQPRGLSENQIALWQEGLFGLVFFAQLGPGTPSLGWEVVVADYLSKPIDPVEEQEVYLKLADICGFRSNWSDAALLPPAPLPFAAALREWRRIEPTLRALDPLSREDVALYLDDRDWEGVERLRRRLRLVKVEMETLEARLADDQSWEFDEDGRLTYKSGKRGRPHHHVTDVILDLHSYLQGLRHSRLKSHPEVEAVNVESDIGEILRLMVDVTPEQIKKVLTNPPPKKRGR